MSQEVLNLPGRNVPFLSVQVCSDGSMGARQPNGSANLIRRDLWS